MVKAIKKTQSFLLCIYFVLQISSICLEYSVFTISVTLKNRRFKEKEMLLIDLLRLIFPSSSFKHCLYEWMALLEICIVRRLPSSAHDEVLLSKRNRMCLLNEYILKPSQCLFVRFLIHHCGVFAICYYIVKHQLEKIWLPNKGTNKTNTGKSQSVFFIRCRMKRSTEFVRLSGGAGFLNGRSHSEHSKVIC